MDDLRDSDSGANGSVCIALLPCPCCGRTPSLSGDGIKCICGLAMGYGHRSATRLLVQAWNARVMTGPRFTKKEIQRVVESVKKAAFTINRNFRDEDRVDSLVKRIKTLPVESR